MGVHGKKYRKIRTIGVKNPSTLGTWVESSWESTKKYGDPGVYRPNFVTVTIFYKPNIPTITLPPVFHAWIEGQLSKQALVSATKALWVTSPPSVRVYAYLH
jgi:hypothetical protein